MIKFRQTHFDRHFLHWPRLLLLCFSVSLSMGVSADDFYTDYGITSTLTWDDNYRLEEDDQVEDTSVGLRVFGELRGGDETTKLRGGVSAGSAKHSDSSIDNSETLGLYASGTQLGERWDGSLDLRYLLEPTTETELLDTGETEKDGTRKSLTIAPGISYRLDERNSVYTDFVFTDVRYDTVSLTEYNDTSVSVGWVHSLSETSQASINGSMSEYDPDDDDTTTITRIYLGYGFSTSEATSYNVDLGYAESDSPDGTSSDGSSSFQMSHTIDERNDFSLSASSGYVASGAGEARYQRSLNLGWSHALAERMDFNLSVQGVSQDTNNRDYVSVVAGIYRRLTREMRLTLSYRRRAQRSDTEDADSNSVLLTLSYSPVSEWSY